MLISIGILARNEESAIEGTLLSLLTQSAFKGSEAELAGHRWEIIVVPNGCSDGTAAVSRRVLAQQLVQPGSPEISWAVRELKEAGKSNAWNHFIHEFSDRDAGLIVLLDADVEFCQEQTLARTIQALLSDPHASAAVDYPLKDALKKPNKSLIERISIAASSVTGGPGVGLCGQFFCARAQDLRRIWMPKGLPVEDGFLGAMLSSDCMRAPADDRRIIRAQHASHYCPTLTSVGAIFRHELRLVIGTTLNCYLIWDFLLFATDPKGPGAGTLIRNQLNRDPHWYAKLIGNAIRNHGWWVLPRGMLLRRFSGGAQKRRAAPLRWWSIAIIGFLLDLPIFLVANRRLKKHAAIGYW